MIQHCFNQILLPCRSAETAATSASGFTAARTSAAAPAPHRAAGGGGSGGGADTGAEVLYPRGPIAGIPEQHASRRERFAELDGLQPGWQVELRGRKGADTVDAAFFSPQGEASIMLLLS